MDKNQKLEDDDRMASQSCFENNCTGTTTGQPSTKPFTSGKMSQSRSKYWKKKLFLYESDHFALSQGKPVSDAVMYAASILLKKAKPETKGLESNVLAQCLAFTPMPALQEGEQCIQIHHDGSFHWLVSHQEAADSTVHLYDSLHCRGRPSSSVELQLAAIYGQEAESTHLDVVFEPAQQQVGSVDC